MISVIICTFNRSSSLKDTLDSLLAQSFGNGFQYEIIIIDNNSVDNTKEVVESYIPKFSGNFKYFYERKQGLSNARNRGVKEAKGNIVTFTDDDVILDPLWLQSIHEAFVKYEADAVFGKILPSWDEAKVPVWLKIDKRLWGCIGYLDNGEGIKVSKSGGDQFYGANFALYRDLLTEMGGFDSNLGVKGSKHYLGEETDIFNKLLESRKKIVYTPYAIVKHKIFPRMMTIQYFLRWYYEGGVSFSYKHKKKKKSLTRIPLWVIREMLSIFLRMISSLVTFNRKDSFWYYLKLIYYSGAIAGFLSLRTHAND